MRLRVLQGSFLGFAMAGLIGCASAGAPPPPSPPPVVRGGHTATACDGQAHDNIVKVPVSAPCSDVYASKSDQNIIMWFAEPNQKLIIEFPGISNPFQFLNCGGHVCVGSLITADPDAARKLKYNVWIDGQKVQDPNVIIVP